MSTITARSAAPSSEDYGAPDPVDVNVGVRLRLRRTLLGLTQQQLGDAIGVTFQQVQKYERGTNRISASRLFDMACVLSVPVSYFFDDLPEDVVQGRTGRRGVIGARAGRGRLARPTDATCEDPMGSTEIVQLANDYLKLDQRQRKALRAFLEATAHGSR
ncbi:MAG: helix-turn-helix domain-containing protein [Caenispirillum bisanense]|nr:helix-turn-helix domain-containing protein [Caenispirillum bisanense]MCA1973604.1 helix-turn-helix domain-containing protein [Caenispirillum sp.]